MTNLFSKENQVGALRSVEHFVFSCIGFAVLFFFFLGLLKGLLGEYFSFFWEFLSKSKMMKKGMR